MKPLRKIFLTQFSLLRMCCSCWLRLYLLAAISNYSQRFGKKTKKNFLLLSDVFLRDTSGQMGESWYFALHFL